MAKGAGATPVANGFAVLVANGFAVLVANGFAVVVTCVKVVVVCPATTGTPVMKGLTVAKGAANGAANGAWAPPNCVVGLAPLWG